MLECGVGKYPYDQLDGGPLGLMMQITQDDPPIPPSADFPPAFCDFIQVKSLLPTLKYLFPTPKPLFLTPKPFSDL